MKPVQTYFFWFGKPEAPWGRPEPGWAVCGMLLRFVLGEVYEVGAPAVLNVQKHASEVWEQVNAQTMSKVWIT